MYLYVLHFNFSVTSESDKIELPYAHIASAATYCEANFTAILYGELACLETKTTASTCDAKLRNLLKNAYTTIGEMDAVLAFLDPIQSRLQYLHTNKSWNQIYLENDAIAFGSRENMARYTNDLAQSGLHALAHSFSNRITGIKYECAWRLGDWNVVDDFITDRFIGLDPKTDFDKRHYFALKSFNLKDEIGTKLFIRRAREALIIFLRQSSIECTKNVYKHLTSLHLLQQIEDFCDVSIKCRESWLRLDLSQATSL